MPWLLDLVSRPCHLTSTSAPRPLRGLSLVRGPEEPYSPCTLKPTKADFSRLVAYRSVIWFLSLAVPYRTT